MSNNDVGMLPTRSGATHAVYISSYHSDKTSGHNMSTFKRHVTVPIAMSLHAANTEAAFPCPTLDQMQPVPCKASKGTPTGPASPDRTVIHLRQTLHVSNCKAPFGNHLKHRMLSVKLWILLVEERPFNCRFCEEW